MRAGSITLMLSALLASTSALGIVLWSSQYGAGSSEVNADTGVNTTASAGDVATVEMISEPSLAAIETFADPLFATLQFDDNLIGAIQLPDPAHFSASELVWPAMQPLSLDIGLAHDQESALTGSGTALLASINSLQAGALLAASPGRWGGVIGGIAPVSSNSQYSSTGGSARSGSSGVNHGSSSPSGVDRSSSSNEQYMAPTPSSKAPHDAEGAAPEPAPGVPPVYLSDPVAVDPPVTTVPEPGTLGLLAVGIAGLLLARRKPRAPHA